MSDHQAPATKQADEELSTSIRPQDDLFGYVNGQWIENNEIPPDLSEHRVVHVLVPRRRAADPGRSCDDAAARAADGEVSAGSPAQLIGDLFASFLDEAQIERLGARPLEDDLRAIEAVATTSDLVARHRRAPSEPVSQDCSRPMSTPTTASRTATS